MALSASAYLLLSALLGVLQCLDALAWLRRPTQPALRRVLLLFSLLEYGWAWVAYRTWQAGLPGVPHGHPAAYMAYVAAMAAAGVMVALLHRGDALSFQPPRDLLLAGAVFGAGFALASASLWLRL
ncbi:MAG: hypothetical protein Q4F13_06025 [Pseudomonadota bacterium]|nr:hypothetical protein [Pseudomonadota bacterium]